MQYIQQEKDSGRKFEFQNPCNKMCQVYLLEHSPGEPVICWKSTMETPEQSLKR